MGALIFAMKLLTVNLTPEFSLDEVNYMISFTHELLGTE